MEEDVKGVDIKTEDYEDAVEDPLAPRLSDYRFIRKYFSKTSDSNLVDTEIQKREIEIKEEVVSDVTDTKLDLINDHPSDSVLITADLSSLNALCEDVGSRTSSESLQRGFVSDTNFNEVFENDEEVVQQYACIYCEYKADKITLLRKHIYLDHKDCKPYACDICDYKTRRNDKLKQHVLTVHEKVKPYKCLKCEFKSVDEYSLKKHVSEVHDRLRAYTCSQCNQSYVRLGYLKKHISVIHDKVKSLECSQCDYKSAYGHQMKFHVLSVHEKLNLYTCSECNKNYSSRSYLRKHFSMVHGVMES